MAGKLDEPFSLDYVPGSQASLLQDWYKINVKNTETVSQSVENQLVKQNILPRPNANKIVKQVLVR